jgi:hypothetical protein
MQWRFRDPLRRRVEIDSQKICRKSIRIQMQKHEVLLSDPQKAKRSRKSLSKSLQVAIFRRDGWLCYWKYGEPKDWDGLASVFMMLAERNPARLTSGEREWLKAIKSSYSQSPRSVA